MSLFVQDDRLEAVSRALDFTRSPSEMRAKFEETFESMKTSILFAREYLKGLKVAKAQMKYICEESIRAVSWLLHDIVIANTVWCMAYAREIEWGDLYCPIVVP